MKNKLIIPIIVLAVIAVGAVIVFTGNKKPSYSKGTITVEQDITPVELTPEGKEALKNAGLAFPEGEDPAAKNLQTVRSSDDPTAIEADLQETDFSQLDAELNSIEETLGK